MKKLLLLYIGILTLIVVKAQSPPPPLIWHQDYGDLEYNQQVSDQALDGSDNYYVTGYVYFGAYGNVLVNKYGPFGNLLWNRQYPNNYLSPQSDQPVGIFPDGAGGATVVACIQRLHSLGHLYHYNINGAVDADYFFGDTITGNTIPAAVINNYSTGLYMFGLLNGVSKVFMCNDTGNILWSESLQNNYNPATGAIKFDAAGNLVLGVFDSVSPQITIHRFDKNTGVETGGFNTYIDSLLPNGSFAMLVDAFDNIFIAGTGTDTGGKMQLAIHKFDTLGNVLWSVQCPSARGHIVPPGGTRFRVDNSNNVLIDGLYADNNDTLQFAAVYKLSNSTGAVLWSAIDTGNFVIGGALQIDVYNNAYLATLKGYTSDSDYSLLSFTKFSADSVTVIWNRSFDNGENNLSIIMQLNDSGDVFFSCTTQSGSPGAWFLGRVGNAANDVAGIVSLPAGTNGMKILPNPFYSSADIVFNSPDRQEVFLKVFDITGKLLDEQELEVIEGINLIPYKAALAPGIYVFRLENGVEALVQKAVVY